jgi:hypothetical protein
MDICGKILDIYILISTKGLLWSKKRIFPQRARYNPAALVVLNRSFLKKGLIHIFFLCLVHRVASRLKQIKADRNS